MPPDDWEQWSKHVLEELKRLSESYEKVSEIVTNLREDIATLKVKSGIWGAIGGIIPILVIVGIWLIFRKM